MKTSVCGGTCKRQMIRRKMSTNLLQNTLSVHNVFPPHPKKTWKPDQLISGWPFKREIECAGLMTIFVLWLSYRVANWVSSINYQKKKPKDVFLCLSFSLFSVHVATAILRGFTSCCTFWLLHYCCWKVAFIWRESFPLTTVATLHADCSNVVAGASKKRTITVWLKC